jgi:signal transduction histidine kinase
MLFVGTIFWYAIHNYLVTIKEKEKSKQIEFEAEKRENETRYLFAKRLIDTQENERNRIALELHDSVGQKLLIAKNLLLSSVRKSHNDTEKKYLQGINDLTGEAINEIRNIIYNLRPQHLDHLGLSTAIETLVENISESSGIKFVINIDKIDNLFPKSDEINFFRIVQESLNNIVKHSNAKDALIDIKKRDDVITLIVKDNGKSSKKNDNTLNGMGLVGIRERSKMIDAELNLDINGKDGTTVILKYPIKQDFLDKEENG